MDAKSQDSERMVRANATSKHVMFELDNAWDYCQRQFSHSGRRVGRC